MEFKASMITGLPEILITFFISFLVFLPALLIIYTLKKKRATKAEEIAKLHKLKSEGALTDKEFERLKRKIF